MDYRIKYEINEKDVAYAKKILKKYDKDKLNKKFKRLDAMINFGNKAMHPYMVLLAGTIITLLFDVHSGNELSSFSVYLSVVAVVFSVVFFLIIPNAQADYAYAVRVVQKSKEYLQTVENEKSIEVLKLKIKKDVCIVKYKMQNGEKRNIHLNWDPEEAYYSDVDIPEIHYKYDINSEYIDGLLIPYDYIID